MGVDKKNKKEEKMIQRFEHKIVECFESYARESLKGIEKEGFELVTAIRAGVGTGYDFIMFFKKPVEDESKRRKVKS